MILEKDIGGSLDYLLDGGTPPDSLAYLVRDPAGTTRHTGTATVPTALAVESTEVLGDGLDVRLTFADDAEIDAAIVPGAAVRVTDSEGRIHDLVCSGRQSDSILVAGITLASGESITSVWCPEVALEIPAAACTTCADGYRVIITATYGTRDARDTLTFAVAPYSTRVPLNVRTFLDWHPEYGQHQTSLIRRRDWPRLVRSAVVLLETKLKASDSWLQMVATPYGLQRAAAEALWYIIGEDYRPQEWSGSMGEYEKARSRRLADAVKDLLSNSVTDAGASTAGTVKEAKAGYWRIQL